MPESHLQFARVFESATGIILFTQVDIAPSRDPEKLLNDAKDLLFTPD
ncbi:MAG: hypothetical protein ACM3KL_04140 [Alphaproteobacteria bacterium]